MARRLNQNNANEEQKKFLDFANEARTLLADLARKHGMKIPQGVGARIGEGMGVFKFEAVMITADGFNAAHVASFKQMAQYDGLSVDMLGQTLKTGHVIAGYDASKRSDKCYVLSKGGQQFFCAPSYIKMNLAART